MSKIEIKPFEEQIRIAGIAGELERAEEKGLEKGLEKGENNIILPLLEKYSLKKFLKWWNFHLRKFLQLKIIMANKKKSLNKEINFLI